MNHGTKEELVPSSDPGAAGRGASQVTACVTCEQKITGVELHGDGDVEIFWGHGAPADPRPRTSARRRVHRHPSVRLLPYHPARVEIRHPPLFALTE